MFGQNFQGCDGVGLDTECNTNPGDALLSMTAHIKTFQPNAQPLALINRLAQAQLLPRNHASKNHQQDGERDLDPFLHDGIMSRMRRNSMPRHSSSLISSSLRTPSTVCEISIRLGRDWPAR